MVAEVVNTTPYAAFAFEHMLFQQRNYSIVIAKQTWQLMPGGGMRLAARQRAVRTGDVFMGEPLRSGIRLPTDLIPYKPQAEVIVVGSACVAQAQPSWLAGVALGQWSKRLRLCGPRCWRKELIGWRLDEPAPTQCVGLGLDNAYGGSFELPPTGADQAPVVVAWPANPGGRGWQAHGHEAPLTRAQRAALQALVQARREIPAPQLEVLEAHLPGSPGSDTPLATFGAFPAWWPQRQAFLRNMKSVSPDQKGYPDDFDMRHWQQTAQDQWLPAHPEGGQKLVTEGLLPEGRAEYSLPRAPLLLYVRSSEQFSRLLDMDIDTLLLDTDARELEIVYRRIVLLDALGEVNIEILAKPT